MFASPVTLRRLALASLVANVIIVVTGGAVRLSGSGLGMAIAPPLAYFAEVVRFARKWHRHPSLIDLVCLSRV